MADRTPAQELRDAAAKLRVKLPGDWHVIPRVVVSEEGAALAFCVDHTNWENGPAPEQPDEHACWNCEVIETISEPVAQVIRDLLASREAVAVWLDSVASDLKGFLAPRSQEAVARLSGPHPLAVARAINGTAS